MLIPTRFLTPEKQIGVNPVADHDHFLETALLKRAESGLLRQLSTPSAQLVDFCSNDYLGFAAGGLWLPEVGNGPMGATGSRLVSGNPQAAEETEGMLARFHQTEAALIFNSGYMANVGLLSSIADRTGVFLYDEQAHASILDGMRLSLAARHKFRHNDVADLEKRLARVAGKKFVVVESVYSMDGDLAPLSAIAETCSRHQAALIVDEAHATGIFGPGGEGLVQALGLQHQVWARVHTFGKALGLHGAAIVGSRTLRRFLINYARPFIYTTGLPPYLYAHIQSAYAALPAAHRARLIDLIGYFRERAQKAVAGRFRLLVNESPIQSLIVPGNEKARRLATFLQESGFFVKAILSPTVPAGTERIRICLHSFNTQDQIDRLLLSLQSFPL